LPKILTEHSDILREHDVEAMLTLIDELEKRKEPVIFKHTDEQGKERREPITIHYKMIKALICIAYLFGKRISEILPVKRKDVYTKRGYLYIRFLVLKKKTRESLAMPIMKVKRVSIKRQRQFVLPIIEYVQTLTLTEMPLFPGRSRPHKQIVKVKDKETGEIKKVYEYAVKHEGLMSRQHAYKILKAINPQAYPHWFRHSLATQLAEDGHTGVELKHWFDWSRYDTALKYVEGSPAMTKGISNRKVGKQ